MGKHVITINGKEIACNSQFGQAEWTFYFFRHLGIEGGTVIEAGASSPESISNSRVFIDNGWNAFLIEKERSQCSKWKHFISNTEKVKIYNKKIEYNSNGLSKLLDEIGSPQQPEVLFLDIDGGEYQLLEGLHFFRPKVICVEYDNVYPLNIDFVPQQIRHGIQASSKAMYRMMLEKGYIYLESFFHDHIFVTKEFLQDCLKSNLQLLHGRKYFIQNAPVHLYEIHKVLAGFDGKTDPGSLRIELYSGRVRNLLNDGYRDEALSFYAYLTLAFKSYISIFRRTSLSKYCESLTEGIEAFHREFSEQLFD
ncbi:hypothetical protein PMIT1313_02018 [Prochlorococcus marinus str. MIT 1313]|uniref:FkbM family methyltransferase n=1 Tax=Prochlorococcus TaxID=1218 RepID=UPI0007B3F8C0|nr:FkbM family methyltransferase [Prochlorococcus marinus]KZR68400.1 hypothetical protein PMIT1313_02018 [Prochlorococcus marinus str. MIT 1313]KZR71362.1 hypothetical protein PMIT1318_02509 [Prochlorococcus marinus str. MIT 1318]